MIAVPDLSSAEIQKCFQLHFRDWANERVHVEQTPRGGISRTRLNQPHVVKLAKILAVANFHFALHDRRHLGFASISGRPQITWI
jgi:hypothetical protein